MASTTDLTIARQRLLEQRLRRQAPAPADAAPDLRRRGGPTAPLSAVQQQLWFLDQLAPGSPLYNITRGFTLVGALDIPALERSLRTLLARHEALRTTFPAQAGRPVQQIGPVPACALEQIDLPPVARAARKAQVAEWLRTEGRRPFDLAHGPLLRATLLRVEDAEHILVFS